MGYLSFFSDYESGLARYIQLADHSALLSHYFNNIDRGGQIIQADFHQIALVAFLFDKALSIQVTQADVYYFLGFDEYFVVGGIGENLDGKCQIVFNVVEARMNDDFLLNVSTTVPCPDFQGCCAWCSGHYGAMRSRRVHNPVRTFASPFVMRCKRH